MGKRIKIGIIYSYNENWIGGAYYIQNLISSLNKLQFSEQPLLYIVTKDKKAFQDLQKQTKSKRLKFVKDKVTYNTFEVILNKIWVKLFGKKIIRKKINLDCLFPVYNIPNNLKHVKNLIFWIPDLQEKFYPDFFSSEELHYRHLYCEDMIRLNYPIVFSSKTALNDFVTFYPNSKNTKFVLPFAVTHPNIHNVNIDAIKSKYEIEGSYFMAPNQFWQHKNHIAIIEAVKILKDKGEKVKIVFTGKEFDHRNPNYTIFLKEKVKEYNLENEIRFLGFIDRIDQLVLMKYAEAIIQPSLFEGWSTVVEDAKALNQTLIVSNIPVHIEQLGDEAYYFEPNDYYELAKNMIEVITNPIQKLKFSSNYKQNIIRFAKNFKEILYK